jgi:hypothetical protein
MSSKTIDSLWMWFEEAENFVLDERLMVRGQVWKRECIGDERQGREKREVGT